MLCIRFFKTLLIVASVNPAAAVVFDEPLADAMHAISTVCITHEEYDRCNNYATNQLAACCPGDLNCQRSKISDAFQYCQIVCDGNDYVPLAVEQFVREQFSIHLKQRDEEISRQGTFVIGNKEVTASSINDVLALKQFVETSDHHPAAWKMLEDTLRPAVTNVRDAFKQPASESAHTKKKRFLGGGGIGSTIKIHDNEPQIGQHQGSHDFERNMVKQENIKKIIPPSSNFFDTAEHGALRGYDNIHKALKPLELRPTPTKAAAYEGTKMSAPEQYVTLYQDIPTNAAKVSGSFADNAPKVRDKVKSYFNLHVISPVGSQPTSSHTSPKSSMLPYASLSTQALSISSSSLSTNSRGSVTAKHGDSGRSGNKTTSNTFSTEVNAAESIQSQYANKAILFLVSLAITCI